MAFSTNPPDRNAHVRINFQNWFDRQDIAKNDPKAFEYVSHEMSQLFNNLKESNRTYPTQYTREPIDQAFVDDMYLLSVNPLSFRRAMYTWINKHDGNNDSTTYSFDFTQLKHATVATNIMAFAAGLFRISGYYGTKGNRLRAQRLCEVFDLPSYAVIFLTHTNRILDESFPPEYSAMSDIKSLSATQTEDMVKARSNAVDILVFYPLSCGVYTEDLEYLAESYLVFDETTISCPMPYKLAVERFRHGHLVPNLISLTAELHSISSLACTRINIKDMDGKMQNEINRLRSLQGKTMCIEGEQEQPNLHVDVAAAVAEADVGEYVDPPGYLTRLSELFMQNPDEQFIPFGTAAGAGQSTPSAPDAAGEQKPAFVTMISNLFVETKNLGKWTWQQGKKALKSTYDFVFDKVKATASFFASFLPNFIRSPLNTLVEKVKSGFDYIKELTLSAFASAKNWAMEKLGAWYNRLLWAIGLIGMIWIAAFGLIKFDFIKSSLVAVAALLGISVPFFMQPSTTLTGPVREDLIPVRSFLWACLFETRIPSEKVIKALGKGVKDAELQETIRLVCRAAGSARMDTKNLIDALQKFSTPELHDFAVTTVIESAPPPDCRFVELSGIPHIRRLASKEQVRAAAEVISRTPLPLDILPDFPNKATSMDANTIGTGAALIGFLGLLLENQLHIFTGKDLVGTANSVSKLVGGVGATITLFELATKLLPVTMAYSLKKKVYGSNKPGVDELLEWAKQLVVVGEKPGMIHVEEYHAEIDDTIQEIEEAIPVATMPVRRELFNAKNALLAFRWTVEKGASVIRAEPYHLRLYGPPGCGKSLCLYLVCTSLGMKKPYARTNGEAYWSAFTPAHDSVIIDEFGAFLQEQPEVEYFNLVSSTEFRPPMAAVEEKGTAFAPKFIVSAGNTMYPRANRDQYAFDRRTTCLVKTRTAKAFLTPRGKFNIEKYRAMDAQQPEKMLAVPWLEFCVIPSNSAEATTAAEDWITWPTLRRLVATGIAVHQEIGGKLRAAAGQKDPITCLQHLQQMKQSRMSGLWGHATGASDEEGFTKQTSKRAGKKATKVQKSPEPPPNALFDLRKPPPSEDEIKAVVDDDLNNKPIALVQVIHEALKSEPSRQMTLTAAGIREESAKFFTNAVNDHLSRRRLEEAKQGENSEQIEQDRVMAIKMISETVAANVGTFLPPPSSATSGGYKTPHDSDSEEEQEFEDESMDQFLDRVEREDRAKLSRRPRYPPTKEFVPPPRPSADSFEANHPEAMLDTVFHMKTSGKDFVAWNQAVIGHNALRGRVQKCKNLIPSLGPRGQPFHDPKCRRCELAIENSMYLVERLSPTAPPPTVPVDRYAKEARPATEEEIASAITTEAKPMVYPVEYMCGIFDTTAVRGWSWIAMFVGCALAAAAVFKLLFKHTNLEKQFIPWGKACDDSPEENNTIRQPPIRAEGPGNMFGYTRGKAMPEEVQVKVGTVSVKGFFFRTKHDNTGRIYLMTVSHVMIDVEDGRPGISWNKPFTIKYRDTTGTEQIWTGVLNDLNITVDAGKDIALIMFTRGNRSGVPSAPKLNFVPENFEGSRMVYWPHFSRVMNAQMMHSQYSYIGHHNVRYSLDKIWWYKFSKELDDGYCGSPCYVDDPNYQGYVVGIHVSVMAGKAFGVGTPVSEETLISLLNNFKTTEVPNLEIGQATGTTEIQPKPYFMANTTKIAATGLVLPGTTSTPANTNPNNVVPVMEASLAISNNLPDWSQEHLDHLEFARKTLSTKLKCMRTSAPARPLTINEAVIGIPGSVEGINFKSSSGYPYVHQGLSKRQIFDQKGNIKSAFFKARFENLCEQAKAGDDLKPVYLSYLKDELRTTGKLPRVIYASPVDYTVLVNQYFGTVKAAATSNWIETGCEIWIGVDCSTNDISLPLHVARSRFYGTDQNTPMWIDADFKNFDQSLHENLMNAANRVITSVQQRLQHPIDTKAMCLTLAKSLSHSVIQYGPSIQRPDLPNGGHVFVRPTNGERSGDPLTTIRNSICGALLMRTIFAKLCPGKHYDNYVVPAHHGDDLLLAIHPEVQPVFNVASIAIELRKLGMDMTGSDKKPIDVTAEPRWKTFEEITILGRHPVWQPDLQSYIGALRLKTIKLLPMYKTKHVTTVEMVVLAIHELSLWDEKTYKENMEIFKENIPAPILLQAKKFCMHRVALRRIVADRSVFKLYTGFAQGKEDPLDTQGAAEHVAETPLTTMVLPAKTEISVDPLASVSIRPNIVREPPMDLKTGKESFLYRETIAVPAEAAETIIAWRVVPKDYINLSPDYRTPTQDLVFSNFILHRPSGNDGIFMTIQIVYNGNAFNNGWAIAAFIPRVYTQVFNDVTFSFTDLQFYSHHIFNLSKQETFELRIPMICSREYVNSAALSELDENFGSFCLMTKDVGGSGLCSSMSFNISTKFSIDSTVIFPRLPASEFVKRRMFIPFGTASGSAHSTHQVSNEYHYEAAVIGTASNEFTDNAMTSAEGGSTTVETAVEVPMDNPNLGGGGIPVFDVPIDISKVIGPTITRSLNTMHPGELRTNFKRNFRAQQDAGMISLNPSWGAMFYGSLTPTTIYSSILKIELTWPITFIDKQAGTTFQNVTSQALCNLTCSHAFWKAKGFRLEILASPALGQTFSFRTVFTPLAPAAVPKPDSPSQYNVVTQFNQTQNKTSLDFDWIAATEWLMVANADRDTSGDPIQNYSLGFLEVFMLNQITAQCTEARAAPVPVPIIMRLAIIEPFFSLPQNNAFFYFGNTANNRYPYAFQVPLSATKKDSLEWIKHDGYMRAFVKKEVLSDDDIPDFEVDGRAAGLEEEPVKVLAHQGTVPDENTWPYALDTTSTAPFKMSNYTIQSRASVRLPASRLELFNMYDQMQGFGLHSTDDPIPTLPSVAPKKIVFCYYAITRPQYGRAAYGGRKYYIQSKNPGWVLCDQRRANAPPLAAYSVGQLFTNEPPTDVFGYVVPYSGDAQAYAAPFAQAPIPVIILRPDTPTTVFVPDVSIHRWENNARPVPSSNVGFEPTNEESTDKFLIVMLQIPGETIPAADLPEVWIAQGDDARQAFALPPFTMDWIE